MKKFGILMIALAVVCTGAFAQAKPKLGVSIYKFDDTFMSYVRGKIETEAQAAKTTISVQDGQGDQSKQNDIVDLFLTQGYNSLAINLVEPASANVVIAKAKAKKVPLVLFNREPADLDLAKFPNVYYVGAKAQESGTMEGQIAATWWKANKPAGAVMHYVMLIGDPANTDAKFRTEFSVKAVKAAGIKVEELAADTAMWQRGDAQNKMQAWLAKFGDKIDFVFANNDDMALGAIEALKAAGYFTGGKYMPVVGVDATPPALDALKQGTLLGTVLNDAVNQGKATYDLAAQLGAGVKMIKTVAPLADKDGKPTPDGHYIWVPYQAVTK
jgi:methyl-galactoside transport system substrate-binding protein